MSDQVHLSLIELSGSESNARPVVGRARLRGLPTKAATKSEMLVGLLTRARGATIDQMRNATGWQAHSVRGFIAGPVKKKLGRSVTSKVTPKGRVYRIPSEASQ